MIEFVTGNILDTSCEVIVNPVNCVGFSSSSMATLMKHRFPGMIASYKESCKKEEVKIGHIKIYLDKDIETGKMRKLINIPITNKIKDPVCAQYIEAGLIAIAHHIKKANVKSIAFPFLGFEEGLSWNTVEDIFKKWNLENPHLDKVNIQVYLPIAKKASTDGIT